MNRVPRALERLFTGTQHVRIVDENDSLFVRAMGGKREFEKDGGLLSNFLEDKVACLP
jgi:hypothetical protein